MKNINWPDHLLKFLAVILGVFIAFELGSFAEKRKEKQELREILLSFVEDIENDRETFDGFQISDNEEQVKKLDRLMENILAEEEDSISKLLHVMYAIQNYSPISSTYASVSSSGKLGLIKDFEVKKMISNYYEGYAWEAKLRGEIQVDFFMQEITPWMTENTNMLDVDPGTIAGNITLVNKLVVYKSLINNKTKMYKNISEAAERLKETLLSELND